MYYHCSPSGGAGGDLLRRWRHGNLITGSSAYSFGRQRNWIVRALPTRFLRPRVESSLAHDSLAYGPGVGAPGTIFLSEGEMATLLTTVIDGAVAGAIGPVQQLREAG
jgi:hypothetical protein